jgi:ArsR family transcriptional regulator
LTRNFACGNINASAFADILIEVFKMASLDEVFKVLGDPVRIRVIRMLAKNGEMCVCRIMEELSMTQSAVSHHLAAMKHAGLVDARRAGQWIYYSLRRECFAGDALEFLQEILNDLDNTASVQSCSCK